MTRPLPRRVLVRAAVLLGVLAPLAGSPYRAARASFDVSELAAAVAAEQDHVTALELAQWIKDRKPGLRVVDVRSSEEFAAYHVPTAEHVTLEALTAAPFETDDTVVLYSDGGAHAAQGWVFLRALGHRQVFFLRGGLHEWLDVMNPVPTADASPAAQAEYARAVALSQYFGGAPRVDDLQSADGTRAASAAAVSQARRRRGAC